VLRLDLADLQVRPRGDVGVSAAVALGEVGDARELPVLENAVRDAQPAHVGVLRRRDIEQPVEAPADIIRRLGRLVGCGLRLEALVAVERVQLALEFLWIGEFLAGADETVLRLDGGSVWADRLGAAAAGYSGGAVARLQATRGARRLQAGHETFQVAFLLGCKFS